MSEFPLPSFRFIVTLDPTDVYSAPSPASLPLVASAGFQEVTGLGAELEVLAHPVGGFNDYVHQLPVRHSWTRLTLKRGVVLNDTLWAWYAAGLTTNLGARRDGAVIHLNPDGTPCMAWLWRAGLAAKWIGPSFTASDNALAIESIEIAHHGITWTPL
jgi:phage tail-like protein